MDLDTAVTMALQMNTSSPQSMWDLAVDEKLSWLPIGRKTSTIQMGTDDESS